MITLLPRPIRIISVEDSLADQQLIEDWMRQAMPTPPRIDFYGSLETALRAAQNRHDYELMLLDLYLPDSSGAATFLTALAQVRIPVVILTDVHDERMSVDAIQRGAYGWIHKTESEIKRFAASADRILQIARSLSSDQDRLKKLTRFHLQLRCSETLAHEAV